MEERFEKIKEIVEKELSCSAHQMDHVMRVYNLSLTLAKGKNLNLNVLRASALLHDIGRIKEDEDPSGETDHAILGAEMAKPTLEKLNFKENEIRHIQECITSHRSRTEKIPKTVEAKILFDADKLDALGTIGIARGFMWVGKNKAKLYSKPPIKQYIKENLGGKKNGRIKDKTKHSVQIEFETKSKFILDKLHTKKAKKIGKKRLKEFSNFIKKLEKEIKGTK